MTVTADAADVRDAVADPLADRATPEALEAAERDGWAPAMWEALHAGGFTTVAVPEDAGGSGGSVAEARAVLEAAGAAPAPVPVAETGLLAGRLLAAASRAGHLTPPGRVPAPRSPPGGRPPPRRACRR